LLSMCDLLLVTQCNIETLIESKAHVIIMLNWHKRVMFNSNWIDLSQDDTLYIDWPGVTTCRI